MLTMPKKEVSYWTKTSDGPLFNLKAENCLFEEIAIFRQVQNRITTPGHARLLQM